MFCASFFFIAPAPTHIYTLSLHDALPISLESRSASSMRRRSFPGPRKCCCPANSSSVRGRMRTASGRSEEHTSELQSLTNLVCRLLLEKKKKKKQQNKSPTDKQEEQETTD